MRHPLFALVLSLWIASPVTAVQQLEPNHEPAFDKDGHTPHKIVHRMSPEIYSRSPFGHAHSVLMTTPPNAGSTTAASSPISYHGGAIMPTVSKVVVIWYGNWSQSNGADNAAGQAIIRDAIWGMAVNSKTYNYAGITIYDNTKLSAYSDSTKQVVNQISSKTIVEYTQQTSSLYGGTTLTDVAVFNLVKKYAGVGDANAIYLVLSSSDIAESSGFLTKYCGWHTYGTIGTTKIKYGFVGNPNRNLAACAVQSTSPNGNAPVDGMISVIAHELIETVTDPYLNAWYNKDGWENSDMCAWTFGSALQQNTSTGAYWNVSLPKPSGGNRNYLLQRQLSNKDSKCYINASGPIQ